MVQCDRCLKSFSPSQRCLITIESQEGPGAESDSDRHLQDIQRSRSIFRGVLPGHLPRQVPNQDWNWQDSEESARGVRFKIGNRFGSIQRGSVPAKDPELKGVGGFEYYKGT
jgi:hypothetical protein